MRFTDIVELKNKRPKYDFGRSWWDYPWDEIKSDSVDGFYNGISPWYYEQTKIWFFAIILGILLDNFFYYRAEHSWYQIQRDKLVAFLRTDDFEWIFMSLSSIPQWELLETFYPGLDREDFYYNQYQKHEVFSQIPMPYRLHFHYLINYWDWYVNYSILRTENYWGYVQLLHTYMRTSVQSYQAFWNLSWVGVLRPPKLNHHRTRVFRRHILPLVAKYEALEDYSLMEAAFFINDFFWALRIALGTDRTWWQYCRNKIRRHYWYVATWGGRYRVNRLFRRDYRMDFHEIRYVRRVRLAFWAHSYNLEPIMAYGWYIDRYFLMEHPEITLEYSLGITDDMIHRTLDELYGEIEVLLNAYQPDYFAIVNMLEYEVYFDAAVSQQIGFQDPATPIMEGIIDLHHDLFFFMVIIFIFVSWMLVRIIYFFSIRNNDIHKPIRFTHHTNLEIIWTIIPSLILIMVAVPSFALVYAMDEIVSPSITIKAIGHQWYWSYEYSDYGILEKDQIVFDSYMIGEEDLTEGFLRLLDVDNRVVLPSNVHVRLLITSADVLHSWAVPSLGVKLDACPGRLNQIAIFVKRNGVFYGQCSEICGVHHGFMPIAVEALDMEDYIDWVGVRLSA